MFLLFSLFSQIKITCAHHLQNSRKKNKKEMKMREIFFNEMFFFLPEISEDADEVFFFCSFKRINKYKKKEEEKHLHNIIVIFNVSQCF